MAAMRDKDTVGEGQNTCADIRKRKTPQSGVILNVVGERGFEPPTHWSQTSCATKLRYSPIFTSTVFFIATTS